MFAKYWRREAQVEPRIKLVFREENGNISAASNSALALATGDFLVLLDHDDILAPHALAIIADAINRHPDADVLYSDEDKLNARGHRYGAYFKPDWNPELLYGQNFISHLGVYRSSLVRALGGFRLGFEGSQDYDLALRATAATKGPVVHVPHVLYHWRVYPGAGTFSSTQSGTRRRCRATRHQGTARGHGRRCERRRRRLQLSSRHSREPRDMAARQHRRKPCGDIRSSWPISSKSLLEKTDYPDMEIIVVDASDGERALPTKMLNKRGVRLVQSPTPC